MSNQRNDPIPETCITESAFYQIINTIGARKAESGGLLLGREDDYVIRKLVFDKDAETTGSTYTFNTKYLNPIVIKLYKEEGLSCLGFIHSHPQGFDVPSLPDMNYFSRQFENMKRKYFYTPIISTIPDGGFRFNGFIVKPDQPVAYASRINIVPDNYERPKENSEQRTSWFMVIPICFYLLAQSQKQKATTNLKTEQKQKERQ